MYVDDIKMAGRTENIKPTWKILMKDVDLEEPTSFLDHADLECTQRECTISNEMVTKYRDMFEARWKVMQRNVWKDIANLRINLLNNYTKSRHHA